MLTNSKIHFFYSNVQVVLKNRTELKIFLAKYVNANSKKSIKELNIIFCTDKELLEKNISFLKHSTYTDILTFVFPSEQKDIFIGEIYISYERIKENAAKFNSTIKQELHRVIFHGILHICGYNDKSKAEKEKMTKMEDKLLALYFKNS